MYDKRNFENKKVTVLGLGKSGLGAVKLLKELGADIRVSDSGTGLIPDYAREALKGIPCEFGGHTRNFIRGSDLVVLSPGLPLNSPGMWYVLAEGIPVMGETELGYLFCRAPILAVTGTNGKSTAATLIWTLLCGAGKKAYLLGNIGVPLCEKALQIEPDAFVILEVSSFQLEAVSSFRPRAAVILNITVDHLDRHPSMETYTAAKMRIFENQAEDDFAVFNHDDALSKGLGEGIRSRRYFFSVRDEVEGAYLSGDDVMLNLGGKAKRSCSAGDLALRGMHNVENLLASCLMAGLFTGARDVSNIVRGFAGLPHRIETVAVVGGVTYIDDSKGTTVDSTKRALESIPGKVVLIAGGLDKGNAYGPVCGLIREKARGLVLIGGSKEKMRSAFGATGVPIYGMATLEEAVEVSARIAREGDTVLLSPMCASFDMFRDYEHRAEVFIEAVKSLSAAVLRR